MRASRVSDPRDLAGVGWDALLDVEDAFQTRAWLEVQARIGHDISVHVAGPAGRAEAGLVTAWADEQTPWLLARPDALLRRAREEGLPGAATAWPGSPDDVLPSLVCGGRHLGRTRPVRRPGAPDAAVDCRRGRRRTRGGRAGRALACPSPTSTSATSGCVRCWRAAATPGTSAETLCWLDVPSDGWEAYLAAMTQHRRRRVRLERRAVEEAGVVGPGAGAAGRTPRTARASSTPTCWPSTATRPVPEGSTRSLKLLAEGLGDDALCVLAELDDEVVGFGVVVRSRSRGREHWFGHRAGFDYEAQGDLPLYYEVLYYRVLELGRRAWRAGPQRGRGQRPRQAGARLPRQPAALVPPAHRRGERLVSVLSPPLAGRGWNAGVGAVVAPSTARGGTLRLCSAADVDSLDPARTYYGWVWLLHRMLSRTLMAYPTDPGPAGCTPVPDLAEAPGEVTDGGRVVTYRLRRGVRYDDGSPVVAGDIRYAVQRTFARGVLPGGPTTLHPLLDDPARPHPGPYDDPDGLPSVEALDDHTLRFHLARPFADLDHLLTQPCTAPVPRRADTREHYGDDLRSTGPYVVGGAPGRRVPHPHPQPALGPVVRPAAPGPARPGGGDRRAGTRRARRAR